MGFLSDIIINMKIHKNNIIKQSTWFPFSRITITYMLVSVPLERPRSLSLHIFTNNHDFHIFILWNIEWYCVSFVAELCEQFIIYTVILSALSVLPSCDTSKGYRRSIAFPAAFSTSRIKFKQSHGEVACSIPSDPHPAPMRIHSIRNNSVFAIFKTSK